ncbi:MAG TPA: hypothetical protein VGC11_12490 [Acidimicrobiia bacterium]
MGPGARLAVVAVVVLAAVGIAYLARRARRPIHAPVRLDGLDLAPGVVAFTSNACDTCAAAMAVVGSLDVPVRRVSHQEEAGVFASAGVESVPLLVVTDRAGTATAQFVGVPPRRALARAVRAAGW